MNQIGVCAPGSFMLDPVLANARNPVDNRKIHGDWDMANLIRDLYVTFFQSLMKKPG
ncbi:MAG: hypothetical protein SCJ97_08670 [Bacillota bacterium]|nr:hypothetical protein [Bacillota bacterium]